MISFNDLARRHAPLRAELDAAIARVLGRGWYILGPEVEAFEREFAAFCDARECVTVANGTDALEIALRALSTGPGDEVVTVANAGMYATTAIRAAGALPVYVDIDPATLLLDADALASCLTSRTRAVIVTHLYGRLADIDAIAGIARERGIALIEDCAQAHGARRAGRRAGTFGTFGCFSFYPTKNLGALGDAGAIVTSDAGLAAKVRALRTYGWRAKYHCEVEGGRNSRLDELQAAVLRVQLPHLDAWNRRRREIAARYASTIAHPAIALPPSRAAEEADVAHLYVVRTPQRASLREQLATAGVATDIHYPVPDHLQPAARATSVARLPHTEQACAEVLSLPCYPELSDAEVDAVATACNRWQPAIRS